MCAIGTFCSNGGNLCFEYVTGNLLERYLPVEAELGTESRCTAIILEPHFDLLANLKSTVAAEKDDHTYRLPELPLSIIHVPI